VRVRRSRRRRIATVVILGVLLVGGLAVALWPSDERYRLDPIAQLGKPGAVPTATLQPAPPPTQVPPPPGNAVPPPPPVTVPPTSVAPNPAAQGAPPPARVPGQGGVPVQRGPVLIVTKGSPATYDGCEEPDCALMRVELRGFQPNTDYEVEVFSDNPGYRNPGRGVTTDAQGNKVFEAFHFESVGYHVWVVVDGIESNHYRW
jgi:hypothetical protein